LDLAPFQGLVTFLFMTKRPRLQQRVEQLEAENRRLQADCQRAEDEKRRLAEENEELRERLEQKEHEFSLLLERFFAPKSERFIEDPNQLTLPFGDQAEGADEGVKQAEKDQETTVGEHRRRKRKPRCEKLPEHLPREVVTVDLPEEEKAGLVCIGYDSTETLIFSPSALKVRETRYPKYIDPSDSSAGVQQRERQAGLVEGNRYDASVAAQIVTAKYGYHLPVYRQQDIFAGSGWTPARSTLLNILISAATLIRPLIEYFAAEVRRDSVLGSDDTSITLLLPATIPKVEPADPKSARVHEVLTAAQAERRSSVTAKMWAYRGVHVPLNVFDFTVSRHRDGPDLFLVDNDYQGTLLGDCYGGNVGIAMRSNGAIVHAACVSHARRKVREARHNHPAHAQRLLILFRELYGIEGRAAELDVAARLELRQAESTAVWDRMREYIDTEMAQVLPKEAMGKAIGYLNNQWEGLTRHLSDGAVPIDNNLTEQLMRQIALGRKNWLFVGSVNAGYRAADLMTLVSSAVRNDLDVWSYVKGVLDALLAGCEDYASLRPDAWAAAHPEHLRQYRIEERQERAERKRQSREERRCLQASGSR
jgi:transposase